jgi:hypothetical protein
MVLLALWLPATSHCRLELLRGFELLACNASAAEHNHDANGCEQDACAVVESGQYKPDEPTAAVPAPDSLVISTSLDLSAAGTETRPTRSDYPSSHPPDLPRPWQFQFRMAQSPRAPSPVA